MGVNTTGAVSLYKPGVGERNWGALVDANWDTIAAAFTSGVGAPVTTVAGRTGAVVLAESDITGLVADLAAKISAALAITAGDYGMLSSGVEEWQGFAASLLNNNWAINSTANQVRVFQFVLRHKAKFTNAIINRGTTTVATKNSVYAIYDSSKNLVFQTPAFDAGTSGILSQAISGGPFTLNPGNYWFACAADATSVCSMIMANVPDTNIRQLISQNTVRIGHAANAMAALVMPSTLGAITAASLGMPLVWFEA